MPSRNLLLCAILGLAIVGAMIGTGLFVSRDTHVELLGKVARVRSAAIRAGQTVVVVDFRAKNPSGYPFMVKSADIELTTADGKLHVGKFVAGSDAKSLFAALPELGGEQFNPSIGIRESVGKQQEVDRMVAAVFELDGDTVKARKKIAIRLKEVDGPVSVIE